MRNGHSVNLNTMKGPGDINDNRRPIDRETAKARLDAMPHGESMELLNNFTAENQKSISAWAADGTFCERFDEYAIAQLIAESQV